MLTSCSRNALRTTTKFATQRPITAVGPTPLLQSLHRHQCRHASYATNARRPGEGGPLPPVVPPGRAARLYNFPIHNLPRSAPRGSQLARANLDLGKLVDRHKMPEAFNLCLKMKQEGVKPNIITYDQLLMLCAKTNATTEAWAIFEDMLCMGIRPQRETFHHLLLASVSREIRETWRILDLMGEYGVSPDQTTYEILILRLVDSENFELSLQFLAEMNQLSLGPTLKTIQAIINLACDIGYPKLALELADAFESTSVRRLESEVWMNCLACAAEHLYADGVTRAWQKVVHDIRLVPDEGCCIAILNTVARHSLPELGMEVIRVLDDMKVNWEEHHFAPLVEAFSRLGDIKEAFEMLNVMRRHGIKPVSETAIPIFRAIKEDYDKVDDAWGILETMHEAGETIDVTALNVIVLASVASGDLQRAVGTYKAFSELDVQPSIDTYNYLLSGCITARHRELGDRLLSEMREAKIKPDAQTYERMVVLCLTQPTYEDAFFYLEEMKAEGHLPPQPIYEAIVRKCVAVGDTRYQIAIEEMKEKGYELTKSLNAFIESGGEHDGVENPSSTPRPSPRVARHKQKEFADV